MKIRKIILRKMNPLYKYIYISHDKDWNAEGGPINANV